MSSMLQKISPSVADVTSGSFKKALPGVAGAAVGYVAWKRLVGNGQGYKSPVVGAVAGVAVAETVSGTSNIVGGLLGVAGAAFLPKYMSKLPMTGGKFMSTYGLPVVGYAVGKIVASLIGK